MSAAAAHARYERIEDRQDTLGESVSGVRSEVSGLRSDVAALGVRIEDAFQRMEGQLSTMLQQQQDFTQRLVKLETKDQAADKRLSRREKVGVGIVLAAVGAFVAKFGDVFARWF